MCFGGGPKDPKAPPPPPTERDANLDGLQKRRQAAAASASTGLQSTLLTGSQGASAPTLKPTLGA